MRAIIVNEDKSLSWKEVSDPVIGADECLIKIEAAGVNRADLFQREGNYPPPKGCPEWMGLEISGTIIEMSEGAKEKSKYKIGDKVCALLGGGGYAEYISIKYDMLMPVPKNCSMIEAAAIPEAFATAYLNLFTYGGAKEGDVVFVTGGSSGLASVIIPMAKAFGMRVITTVRSSAKADAIKHLGADVIIDTSNQDLFAALMLEKEKGYRIDIAIDCIGGENMGKCLYYMARGGRWIMIASMGGKMTNIDLTNVFAKNIRIIGSTLRSLPPQMKARILGEIVEKMWDKVESRELLPTVCKVFPIMEADAAQEYMRNGENIGKIVLSVE